MDTISSGAPRLAALLLSCAVSTAALASPETTVPNPAVNPGARNHLVNQNNIEETICVKGWTKTVRPPVSWTNALKHKLLERAGLPPSAIHDYELDHLVPLELGGAPADHRNLWLQSWTGTWNAHVKDDLENRLHTLVCRGEITLQDAQEAIAANWTQAYQQFMAARAKNNREHRRAHNW